MGKLVGKLLDKYKSNKNIKGGIVFTIIEMVNKVLPFLLLPLLARKLAPEDFGIITNYTVLVSILLVIVNFGGIPNIIVRYRSEGLTLSYKKYLDSSLVIALINTLIILLCLLPIVWLGFAEKMGLSFLLVFLGIVETFFDAILMVYIALSRYSKSFKSLAIVRIGQTVFSFGLTLILVYQFNMSYEGRIFSIFASSVGFGILAIIFQKYSFPLKGLKSMLPTIKELYTVCWPLIPHQTSKLLRNGSDKIIITSYIGLTANGLYSMSMQFATIFYIVVESFSMSFLPNLYENLNKGKIPRKIVRNFNMLCIGLLIPFYSFCYFVIYFFFDHRYQDVKFYLIPILISFFFRALNLMQGNQFMYFKKTKDYSKVTVVMGIVHLCISIISVKIFGVKGILILLLFTESSIFFITNKMLKKLHLDEKLF